MISKVLIKNYIYPSSKLRAERFKDNVISRPKKAKSLINFAAAEYMS